MTAPPERPAGEGDGLDDLSAVEVNRRKDEYIALLAHELRNLLAPIRYAIAALEKADKTVAQQNYALGVMRRQSTHMSRLLEDLLDVARFGRGELELRKGAAELTVVLGSAIEAARPLLDHKQHSFSVELPSDPLRIWADPMRLVQVFSNLLINAAKYTDIGGRIELRATKDQDTVMVCVRDSGIGIAPELMPRIFTLFAQGKGAGTHSEGGLGVGLALAHGIVSLHGGTLDVHSAGCGCGSEFVVRIPIGVAPPELPVANEIGITVRRTGLRVLVVDDNKDVADTCAMLIELSGHQVHVAYTAREGMDKAESFRPQVILTDIGLPDSSGYVLAQNIRSTSWGGAVVLVAVTGWGEQDRQRQSDEAGFDHHLTKPIDPRAIEVLLESLAANLD